MVERVIVQTQSEYASMNRDFLKWVFLIGTLIIGLIILTSENKSVSKLFGIIFLLPMAIWIYRKIRKKNKKGHHEHHSPNNNYNKGFVRGYLIWFITFTIGIVIAYIIRRIYLPDMKIIWFVIISGILIEVCSKIMQIFVLKHKWIVDKHFLFWVIVQIGLFYLSYTIVEKIISIQFLFSLIRSVTASIGIGLILIGIIQTILVHIVWKLNIERRLFK